MPKIAIESKQNGAVEIDAKVKGDQLAVHRGFTLDGSTVETGKAGAWVVTHLASGALAWRFTHLATARRFLSAADGWEAWGSIDGMRGSRELFDKVQELIAELS
jgi:hypothetical protein